MLYTHPKILLLKTSPLKLLGYFFKKPNFGFLENELRRCFPSKHFLFTTRGIAAFEIIIKKYNLQNSQIALPAFICQSFYPILKKHNIKPCLIDSEKQGFNISLTNLREKLAKNPNVKALVVCHTFGEAVDIAKIKQLFSGLIIEDLSHGPLAINPKADIAFMSLAKMFPVLNGGLLISDKPLKEKHSLSRFNLNVFAYFLKHCKENSEKKNANALALKEKLKGLNIKLPNPPFAYFSVLIPAKRDAVFALLKKQGIKAGRVWQNPLISSYQEQISQNPNANLYSQQVLNLPIQPYFTEKELNKIANSLKLVLQKIGA